MTEQKQFPFKEFCAICEKYKTARCTHKDKADSLVRWKSLNCLDYETKK